VLSWPTANLFRRSALEESFLYCRIDVSAVQSSEKSNKERKRQRKTHTCVGLDGETNRSKSKRWSCQTPFVFSIQHITYHCELPDEFCESRDRDEEKVETWLVAIY
jgi:hypothetical protein